ncbi:MAG TPA: chloride channel protein [Polyangia bacterium]|jgi:CIC family chloride channel protein
MTEAKSRQRTLRAPATGKRLFDWVHGRARGLAILALAVGIGAGLGAVLFRYLIMWLTIIFTGHADYSAADHAANPFVAALGFWFLPLAPVVGGLLYGPLIARFAPEARGHGVPEVMLAVAQGGARIRPRVAIVKSLASALCIGSGGSVGREGPIVQIGSALGSALGQLLRVPESRLRLLVACGAAGGISATFNAPIAGVVFALELILRDFEAEPFGVVVLSSVAANIIGRAAFGAEAFLALPAFEVASNWEYGLYAGLGLLAALVGIGFVRVLYAIEDLVERLWRGPEGLRPAVGGVVLGLILLALPQMYGVGYPVMEQAIASRYSFSLLMILLAGKIVATSVTIGMGGSGGVFAPSMFIGAMLGSGYGDLLHRLAPTVTGPAGAYGLIGMGAVFAAAARAPLTAVIIIFELTGEYRIILPLLSAVAVATWIANLITRDTIYTLKLRRRGIDLSRQPAINPIEGMAVKDAMEPIPRPLHQNEALATAIKRLSDEHRDVLPVVDDDGRYRGLITAREVETAMRTSRSDVAIGDLAKGAPTVKPDDKLDQALHALVRDDLPGLAVLNQERAAIGWLTHRSILRAYRARLNGGGGSADRVTPPAARSENYRSPA